MSSLHQTIEQIWWRKQRPPLLLRCLAPIYRAISRRDLQQRANRAINPPIPMISVGNITAGGSGKTPFTLWLADALHERGFSPVLLCRGDGGTLKQPTVVSSDHSAALVGDEAKMLATLSAAPVIAAADRVAGSTLAGELGDLIILDDGFQYRQLSRCCDIVLIPAEGVGNGHTIPAGPLREPLSALKRADLIVRTGSSSELAASTTALGSTHQWQWQRQHGDLIDIQGRAAVAPEKLCVITAIARPQRFLDDLGAAGYNIVTSSILPDHHRFQAGDIEPLLRLGEEIVVTAKDAVKLQPLWPKEKPLWVLPLQGAADAGLIEAIVATIPQALAASNSA